MPEEIIESTGVEGTENVPVEIPIVEPLPETTTETLETEEAVVPTE